MPEAPVIDQATAEGTIIPQSPDVVDHAAKVGGETTISYSDSGLANVIRGLESETIDSDTVDTRDILTKVKAGGLAPESHLPGGPIKLRPMSNDGVDYDSLNPPKLYRNPDGTTEYRGGTPLTSTETPTVAGTALPATETPVITAETATSTAAEAPATSPAETPVVEATTTSPLVESPTPAVESTTAPETSAETEQKLQMAQLGGELAKMGVDLKSPEAQDLLKSAAEDPKQLETIQNTVKLLGESRKAAETSGITLPAGVLEKGILDTITAEISKQLAELGDKAESTDEGKSKSKLLMALKALGLVIAAVALTPVAIGLGIRALAVGAKGKK